MGGTKEGGIKTAAANRAKDPDYYKKIGKMGGTTPKTKPHGFAVMDPEKRSAAGRKGGLMSRKKGPNSVYKYQPKRQPVEEPEVRKTTLIDLVNKVTKRGQ